MAPAYCGAMGSQGRKRSRYTLAAGIERAVMGEGTAARCYQMCTERYSCRHANPTVNS